MSQSVNKALNEFKTTMIQTVEDIRVKQMSIINLNMINTIKIAILGHYVNHK